MWRMKFGKDEVRVFSGGGEAAGFQLDFSGETVDFQDTIQVSVKRNLF